MRKQTEEMIKVIDEAMDYCVKNAFLSSGNMLDTFGRISPEELKAIDMLNRAMKMTKNYMLEAADQMDRIESKLDLLLKLDEDKRATP